MLDDGIAEKWKQEALESENPAGVTQEMVDWCIEELRFKAKIFEKTGMVTAYDGDVVKSDSAVAQDLKGALRDAVKPLEDIHPSRRDWHPGSNDTVLDLVHPSLFPLVYGQTRILPDVTTSLDDCIERCGQGVILDLMDDKKYSPPTIYKSFMDAADEIDEIYSKRFQWLPCDVSITGGEAKSVAFFIGTNPRIDDENA